MVVASRPITVRAGSILLIALLVAAFGLRIWALNDGSVWHDEGWSIRAIRDPIGTPDDKTPLLYYSLIHLLWQGAGETPFALRYGSALLGLLTVAVGAQIARRWAGWEAGILTGVFLAVSPLMWAYSREIRAYAGVPLLALVLLWQADALLRPRDRFPWRLWGLMLLAEIALLYTHNLSVPVVGWLNVVIGGVWFYQRRWRELGIWLGGQVGVLIVYLPWVLGQAPSGTPLNTPPDFALSLVWDIWQSYFAPLPTQVGAENALVIGSAVLGLFALGCLAAALTWRWDRRTWLLLSQVVIIPLLATIELVIASIDFHPRYYIASVPATLIVIALGVASVPEKFEVRWLVVPAAIALACGVAAASLTGLLDKPKYQHDDFHALADYYARLPDDALIIIPYGWEPALDVYYADKVGIRAEMVGIDLHSDAVTAIAEINAALEQRKFPVQVELLTWFQLPADMRGMYSCVLESAGTVAESFTVQGITTQGYRIDRPIVLAGVEIGGTGIDYGLIALDGAAAGGQAAICLHTAWTLQQSTAQDWRVAARLLTIDPPGWTVARSDTDIRRDDQAPTSDWRVDQTGDAFSLLRFPAGAPPGDYVLDIGVYNRTDQRVLDRLVDGIPSGTRVQLAMVQPQGTLTGGGAQVDDLAITINERVSLAGHDAQAGVLNPGQELRITLRWQVTGDGASPWTDGSLVLRGADWEIVQPVAAYAAYSLDWHTFVIPAGVSGAAELVIESPGGELIPLVVYTIEESDHLFAPPPFDVPVRASFGNLAVLEGFSVGQETVSPDEMLDLRLVWRVEVTPGTSYKVFTHLLDVDGRVIAQHDGYPVNGDRLTTGWVMDEYIVDAHTLEFEPERTDYRGPARLEVGFYNPATGTRIPVANGVDYVILPLEITVQ
ncbi:MAG: hypothetical protein JXQ72_10705 [Anaerolineae bacterium]|nr:hypothetical protein [Anaerolineae bacterium]